MKWVQGSWNKIICRLLAFLTWYMYRDLSCGLMCQMNVVLWIPNIYSTIQGSWKENEQGSWNESKMNTFCDNFRTVWGMRLGTMSTYMQGTLCVSFKSPLLFVKLSLLVCFCKVVPNLLVCGHNGHNRPLCALLGGKFANLMAETTFGGKSANGIQKW